jgi:hypothetical protein
LHVRWCTHAELAFFVHLCCACACASMHPGEPTWYRVVIPSGAAIGYHAKPPSTTPVPPAVPTQRRGIGWHRCASCASAAWRYLPPASAAWAARIGSLPSRTSPRAPSVAATAQSTHCRKAGFGRGRAHMNSCRAPCCWSTRCSILCERAIALKSAMRAQADGDCWKGMNHPVHYPPVLHSN